MAAENTLRLYNTLTNRVEPLQLLEPGHLRFYSCGPTVYSFAHIGNFRTFITADLLVRTARASGWKTTYVTNITDVGHLTEDDIADAEGEDRMAKALQSKEGQQFVNVWDLARYYTDELLRDWKALNLLEPDVRPHATEHMRGQIKAIEALIAKGHAYEAERGVYFSVPSFPEYGKLSGNRSGENLEHAVREVVVDTDKKDPRDFALWKKDDKHLMQWFSPWGWGFPGWHLECSVMANTYLGPQIDLHAGGEDLIFPHHECEIAQSECLNDRPFANHWIHTRFLQVEGEKMSKSKGNFFTVRQLIDPVEEGGKGIDPLALRLTLLSGYYRKPFNFTFKTLKASARHIQRFQAVSAIVDEAVEAGGAGEDVLGERLESVYNRALEAMKDDLNTPMAVSAALGGVKMIQGIAALSEASAKSAQKWLGKVNDLLGIITPNQPHNRNDGAQSDFEQQVEALLKQRTEARKQRDFARADAIRNQITELGVEIMDSPEGTKWRKSITS